MQKHDTSQKRDWTITLLFGTLALFPISGIVGVWEYASHSLYFIASILVPLVISTLFLVLVAANGTRKFITDVIKIFSNLIYWLG